MTEAKSDQIASGSGHTICWVRPDLAEEEWEFSKHPAKQPFYRDHGIHWGDITSAFEVGILEPYPRGGSIGGISVALSYHSYDDYARYLAKAKRNYRRSYAKMEEELQRTGTLTLKAPIVLHCGADGLLFSGYRRLCLAWNYGIVPYVWLVPLKATAPVLLPPPKLDSSKCTGCGRCVAVCGGRLLTLDTDGFRKHATLTSPGSCTRCLACVAACPVGAASR